MRPYYEDASVTLYRGDCRDVLPTIDGVNHAIFDPPYSEHVINHSVRGHKSRPGGRRQALGFGHLEPALMAQVGVWCATSVSRWTVVFSDMESGHLWRSALCDCEGGLDYIRSGVWVKEHPTPQMTGDRPAIGVELITLAHPFGRKRWNGGGKPAVWRSPTAYGRGDAVLHTTQKPEQLMLELILDFTDVGELALDPFAGSGTTGIAAKRAGRRAILIEQDARYCAVIAQRLAETDVDERLTGTKDPRAKQVGLFTGPSTNEDPHAEANSDAKTVKGAHR